MSDCHEMKEEEEEMEVRRGPWTAEEDALLINYIACHGDGRWNLLAKRSGLKRTGKSCRLRWLNYLKPDVKRGNLTPEEQMIILELHSKWGNRWSRIAQHLPGRTDNEIKNYWRTRVQKQARQLKIDANSAAFRDAVRCFWLPRLLEKIAQPPPPMEIASSHWQAAYGPSLSWSETNATTAPSTSTSGHSSALPLAAPAVPGSEQAYYPTQFGEQAMDCEFELDGLDLGGFVIDHCEDGPVWGGGSIDELWQVRMTSDQW